MIEQTRLINASHVGYIQCCWARRIRCKTWACDQLKPTTGEWITLKQHVNSRSCTLKPAIQSDDTQMTLVSGCPFWQLSICDSIGHFRVLKTLTFKMRLGAHSFLWKWVLLAWDRSPYGLLHENENWFPYQRLSTYLLFETEAEGELGNGLMRP